MTNGKSDMLKKSKPITQFEPSDALAIELRKSRHPAQQHLLNRTRIRIGEYVLSQSADMEKVFIFTQQGEGGSFSAKQFEGYIKWFFQKHF
jgi:hypothetical protein